MIISKIGNFPLYILENEEETEYSIDDPFNYIVRLIYKDENVNMPTHGKVICNSIPCAVCAINNTYNSGKNKTQAIFEYIKNEHSELFCLGH